MTASTFVHVMLDGSGEVRAELLGGVVPQLVFHPGPGQAGGIAIDVPAGPEDRIAFLDAVAAAVEELR